MSNKKIFLLNFIRHVSSSSIFKPFSKIPGPKAYPLVGNLFELKSFGGDLEMSSLYEFFDKLHKKYGDIVKWNLFNRIQIFIFNPEHVKKIHQIDGLMPSRKPVRPWMFYYKKHSVPVPIFSSSDERWRRLRTAANPIAARPQTIYLYIDKHIEVIDEFINLIDNKLQQNGVMNNFEKQLQHLSLEMVGVVALDQRIGCVDDKSCNESLKKLINSIEDFMWFTNKLSVSLPFWQFYETKDRKLFFNAIDYTYNSISKYIKEALARLSSKDDGNERSILQQLLLYKDKYNLTIEDIESIMVDFIMAGVDTTALTLQYMIIELGRNQEIQDNLYNEINKVIKSNEKLSQENIYKIGYLKMILKETLRYHNVVPAISRILKEDLILDDYKLPKGTAVNFCPIHITHSEKYFKNPFKFDPDRWSNENSSEIHPYAALPFGFGPRMCLGRRVSEQEIYITIIKLIQKFKIEYIGGDFKYKYGLITVPDKPLKIRLEKRI